MEIFNRGPSHASPANLGVRAAAACCACSRL